MEASSGLAAAASSTPIRRLQPAASALGMVASFRLNLPCAMSHLLGKKVRPIQDQKGESEKNSAGEASSKPLDKTSARIKSSRVETNLRLGSIIPLSRVKNQIKSGLLSGRRSFASPPFVFSIDFAFDF